MYANLLCCIFIISDNYQHYSKMLSFQLTLNKWMSQVSVENSGAERIFFRQIRQWFLKHGVASWEGGGGGGRNQFVSNGWIILGSYIANSMDDSENAIIHVKS
jgi:hypothetical protein